MRKKIILILIVFVVLSLLAWWLSINFSQHHSRTNELGNRLAEYFYYTNTDAASELHLNSERARNARNKNPELRDFYNKLDWQRRRVIEYKSDPDSAWNQIDHSNAEKPSYLQFWQTLRPIVQETYYATLPPLTVPHPVVHFRCSDVPFKKYAYYYLSKVSTVKWMAQKIKERGFTKVTMLGCNKHRQLAQKVACHEYIDFYAQTLKDSGLDVELQCNSILQDFSMMVYSPLLVSLNTSSFSFMAGVSKNPQDYISCNMGVEFNGKFILQTQADWLLDNEQPLLHQEVSDYNHVDDVIKKL